MQLRHCDSVCAISEDTADGGHQEPTHFTGLVLYGALARKAPGAGALASIDGKFLMFAVGMSPTPELGAAVQAHVELVQNALAAWDSGRMYLNFAEKRQRGERLFGDLTYRRLQTVKAAVDPDDVFRSNLPVGLPAAPEARRAA